MKVEVLVVPDEHGLLQALEDRSVDAQPALRAIADRVRERQAHVFATGGNGRWAPNDESTAATKGTRRVLVDTGGLLDSFTQKSHRYAREQVTPDSVRVTSANPVANLPRVGARGQPVRDPAPDITREELAEWSSELLGFLVDGQA